jgi:hypothetical protein
VEPEFIHANASERVVHQAAYLRSLHAKILRREGHVSSTTLATIWLSGFWNTMPPSPGRVAGCPLPRVHALNSTRPSVG